MSIVHIGRNVHRSVGTKEINPESGTTQYFWDAAPPICYNNVGWSTPGDLGAKLDANGVYTCNGYDGLHRLQGYLYRPSSGCGGFIYDSSTPPAGSGITVHNTLGRLVEAYTNNDCNGTQNVVTDKWFGYSTRGEVTDIYSSTPNSNGYYHLNKSYWANGAVNTLSGIPGVPTITYGADGEGRPSTVSASSGQNPVTQTLYNAASQVTSLTYGSGDSDTYQYDPNTGRMTQYGFNVNGSSVVGKLTWNSNATLQELQITQDPFNSANVQTCMYGYDALARVNSVGCGNAWAQTFSYDPFGNITKAGSSSWQPTYASPANNQYKTGWNGISYDNDGNLTNDTFHTYQWDANGHPIVVGASTFQSNQTYDALGNMVEQNIPAYAYIAQFLQDSDGHELAFSAAQAAAWAWIPLPGGATAIYSAGIVQNYWHADWLGSSRFGSTPARGMFSDRAFAPFGEPYASAGSAYQSFAGMLQNIMPDLFETPNREYHPTQGRWITPDPAGLAAVDATNPQSWNRYAYALNNPLSNIDPSGLECVWDDGSYDSADDPNTGSVGGCSSAGGTYFDPSTFSAPNGDWSDQPNQQLADEVDTQGDYNFQTQSTAQMDTFATTLACAAQFGQNHSIAAAFGAQNNFVANLFGGNTVSSLVNLGLFVSGNKTPTLAQLAAIPLKGAAQGIPVPPGNPGLSGATGQLRSLGVRSAVTGAYNAFAGVGQETIELGITASGTVATPAAQLGAQSLTNVATGVGLAKFALDLTTFAIGFAKCE